jgi:basic amino acid/polyamine antiporter, APA family
MEPIRQDSGSQAPQAHFSLWDTICIIVGIIIGIGIFKTPGSVFALFGGPLQALAVWVAGGLLCVVGAFCFAELASTYPRSGGDYVYLTRAFGSWAGFLFAWGQLLIVRTGASIVPLAYVFAEYTVTLLQIDKESHHFLALYTLLALAPVVGLTIVNVIGVESGKRTQNALTVVKVLGLTGVLIAGFVWGVGSKYDDVKVYEGAITQTTDHSIVLEPPPPNWPGKLSGEFELASNTKLTLDGADKIDDRNLVPSDLLHMRAKVVVGPDGRAASVKATEHAPWGAIALALIMVLWTYSGWHEGAYVAAEVENQRRNLPRALLLGTAAVIVLYLLVNMAYIWGLGYEGAADSETVAADVLRRVPGGFGGPAISVLVMLSALGAINGMLCTNSRIFAEFGHDHALFAPLGRWSRRFGTPVAALMVQLVICVGTIAAIALVIGSFQTFERLIRGTAPVFWLFFLGAGLSVFVLRWKDRGIERPFTAPLYPLTPLLFCGSCLLMVIGSAIESPVDAAIWLGILLLGVPLYWLSRHTPSGLPLVAQDKDR